MKQHKKKNGISETYVQEERRTTATDYSHLLFVNQRSTVKTVLSGDDRAQSLFRLPLSLIFEWESWTDRWVMCIASIVCEGRGVKGEGRWEMARRGQGA